MMSCDFLVMVDRIWAVNLQVNLELFCTNAIARPGTFSRGFILYEPRRISGAR
ncbi:hypothetical protein QUB68_18540 [Microcoleus sp. A006_D1]|uniref:hypothetical protein n=1 Tax=Microcoleus sp. A006_D1 TaxID=3055267 RepID=UPI002FCF2DD7